MVVQASVFWVCLKVWYPQLVTSKDKVWLIWWTKNHRMSPDVTRCHQMSPDVTRGHQGFPEFFSFPFNPVATDQTSQDGPCRAPLDPIPQKLVFFFHAAELLSSLWNWWSFGFNSPKRANSITMYCITPITIWLVVTGTCFICVHLNWEFQKIPIDEL